VATTRTLIVRPGEGTPIPFGPTIKVGGESTDESFSFMETTLPPGVRGPPSHVHNRHDESLYVVSGELTLLLEEGETTLPPGTFALIPHGIPHTFANRGNEPVHLIGISTPAGIEQMLLEMSEIGGSGAPDIAALREIALRYDSDFT
jgi:mannose-6-phosphate isomerase-like protein (cupin superfamily)